MEAIVDEPYSFMLAYSTSVTRRMLHTVPGWAGDFKVIVENQTGATVTVDVYYRQLT